MRLHLELTDLHGRVSVYPSMCFLTSNNNNVLTREDPGAYVRGHMAVLRWLTLNRF
jgi:hypothetical protein